MIEDFVSDSAVFWKVQNEAQSHMQQAGLDKAAQSESHWKTSK